MTTPAAARSADELRAAIARGARPKYLTFWGHRPRRPGEVDASCLSQWWPVKLFADGHRFGSAEHYMMWRKARLFADDESAKAILVARSAAHAKAQGRAVASFDEERWIEHRWEIVVDASVAKFSADERLHDYLIGTGARVLVEASPVDRIWGVGLAADSPDATRPTRWRGLNLLGFALMEARARLQG